MTISSEVVPPAVIPVGRLPVSIATVKRSSSVSLSMAVPRKNVRVLLPPPTRTLWWLGVRRSPGSVSIPVTFTGIVTSSQFCTGTGPLEVQVHRHRRAFLDAEAVRLRARPAPPLVPDPGSVSVAPSAIVMVCDAGLPIVSQFIQPY